MIEKNPFNFLKLNSFCSKFHFQNELKILSYLILKDECILIWKKCLEKPYQFKLKEYRRLNKTICLCKTVHIFHNT